MKDLVASALTYRNGSLSVLDQRLLPDAAVWLPCASADAMIGMIKQLQIRGAPLIGIGASVLLAHLAEQGASVESLRRTAAALRAARPTAVNLMHCMDRMLTALEDKGPSILGRIAEQIFEEDVALCAAIAEHGARLLNGNGNIMTYCNTGSLATAGVGTAIGVIRALHQRQGDLHVWINETRPLLQGGRLTAWEIQQLGINGTLICDNMAAALMAQGRVDCIVVGADRIAVNGDFANKVGTYSLAVNASYHKVPFYVTAPYTTVDSDCPNGKKIPIEQRDASEVRGVSGNFGSVRWSPQDCAVYNPAFDVTPASLVTAWILDRGVYHREQIEQGALRG